MIVRKGDGQTLVLIGQTDHSRFVGQLAAHWGNGTVAPPQPYTSVVRAAAFHDFGWLRYETSPLLDADSGEPYQFLHVPMTEEQLGRLCKRLGLRDAPARAPGRRPEDVPARARARPSD